MPTFTSLFNIFFSSLCELYILPRGPGQRSRYSDSLRTGRSGDRIPVGARFPAPVQTGPGAYPASCTMSTGSFLGVKRPGRGADHPPPSKSSQVGLYLYSPSGPSWPVMGARLPLPLYYLFVQRLSSRCIYAFFRLLQNNMITLICYLVVKWVPYFCS